MPGAIAEGTAPTSALIFRNLFMATDLIRILVPIKNANSNRN